MLGEVFKIEILSIDPIAGEKHNGGGEEQSCAGRHDSLPDSGRGPRGRWLLWTWRSVHGQSHWSRTIYDKAGLNG